MKSRKEKVKEDIKYHGRVILGFEIIWIVNAVFTVFLLGKMMIIGSTPLELILYTMCIWVSYKIWKDGSSWEISKRWLEFELIRISNEEEREESLDS